MEQNLLDEQERFFLKGLKTNPIWRSIIDKLSKYSVTPRFNPSKDRQVERWMYESGRLDEQERIVTLLTVQEKK